MRTEEEKLLKAPIVVTLGGKEYEIEPLVIKEARGWRKQVAKIFSALPQHTMSSLTTDDAEAFGVAMHALLVEMPDGMADLFFAYAKDLNREEIESKATELELAKAIEAVMEVAFPLLRTLTGTPGKLAQ